jgi:hypothetical protein
MHLSLRGEKFMANTIGIILDLSDEMRELVEQQQIDLYREIQDELPSVQLEVMSDPAAPPGSRDIVPVIIAIGTTATAISSHHTHPKPVQAGYRRDYGRRNRNTPP